MRLVEKAAIALLDLRRISGSSVLRVALYPPGEERGGRNALNGNNINDARCVGQNDAYQRGGRYKLAIGRDWGQSKGLFLKPRSLAIRSAPSV
ncbi:MAG: hypothetical protein KTR16_02560 [Acidiferrobacterales bacterium]|nr:hypothetical protein [Acidiferrobacterales bacterium]